MSVPILYHYTTHEGLLGILQSHSVWATHSACLNDPHEMHYGRGLCSKVLNKIAEEESGNARVVGRLHGRLQKECAQADGCYIISLSEEKDLLSQWIAYSNGGAGFAVEFDFNHHPLSGALRKVEYEPEAQEQLIRECVRKKLDLATCAFLKQEAFSAEKEWRLALPCRSQFARRGVRVANSRLVPFVAVDTRHNVIYRGNSRSYASPITGIWIGPKNDFSLTKLSVEIVLQNARFHKVTIHEASFRLR